jgi:hypothetical protein
LPPAPLDHRAISGDRSKTIAEAMITAGQSVEQSRSNAEQEHQNLKDMIMQSINRDTVKRLNKRICPHCHCTVPPGIGDLPVFRIAMLGGKASGKTTYMLLAISQIIHGNNANNTLDRGLHLAGGSLVGESAQLYNELFDLYRQGVLNSTEMVEDKGVFPLVLQVNPRSRRHCSFFLVLQDFPGEGMRNDSYLINNRAVLGADGAILLVDPGQLRQLPEENQIENPMQRETYCNEELEETCDEFRKHLNLFENLRSIIVTLNKIDKLYENRLHMQPHLVMGNNSMLDIGSLQDHHISEIDPETLELVSRSVCYIFANLMNLAQDVTITENRFRQILGCEDAQSRMIHFKGISAHTWSEGAQSFRSNLEMSAIGNGHRLLEPVLELLGQASLLPVKPLQQERGRLFQRGRGTRDPVRN